MDEYEAKQLVTAIGSPIWRAKILGTVHPMPHNVFWKIILFIDQQQDAHYTILNATYDHETLNIESRAGGQPSFLAEVQKQPNMTLAFLPTFFVANHTFLCPKALPKINVPKLDASHEF